MKMRLHLIATLATATVALHQQYPPARTENQQFTLLMTLSTGESRTNLSLTTIKSSQSDVLLLVGKNPATCVGTPAFLNASLSNFEGAGGEYVALQLDVDGEVYGVGVPPLGDMHGAAYTVSADKGYSEFQFRLIDNQVFHKPSSGVSEFLACNKTIDGEIKPVLSWGSAPYLEGCASTTVHQRCNIEESSVTCN